MATDDELREEIARVRLILSDFRQAPTACIERDPLERLCDAADALAQAREERDRLQAESELHRRWHRKPTHGPCCTCQKCGLDYDTCRCSLDDLADEIDQQRAELTALRARVEQLSNALTLCALFLEVPSHPDSTYGDAKASYARHKEETLAAARAALQPESERKGGDRG